MWERAPLDCGGGVSRFGGEAEISARGVKHESDVRMQVMATLRCAKVVVGSFAWIGEWKMLGLEV